MSPTPTTPENDLPEIVLLVCDSTRTYIPLGSGKFGRFITFRRPHWQQRTRLAGFFSYHAQEPLRVLFRDKLSDPYRGYQEWIWAEGDEIPDITNFKRDLWTTNEVIQILDSLKMPEAVGSHLLSPNSFNAMLGYASDAFRDFARPMSDIAAAVWDPTTSSVLYVNQQTPQTTTA